MAGVLISDLMANRVKLLQEGSVSRQGSFSGDKVALFANYTTVGKVQSPSVMAQLVELEKNGWPVVVIDTSDHETHWPSWVTVIQRPNIGQDWGSWATALHMMPELWNAKTVLQMNDSMVGPLYPMGGVLRWMETQQEGYVGLIENTEIEYHLSAMFVAYTNNSISHPAYEAFWRNIRTVERKASYIYECEIELSRIAIRENIGIKPMFTCHDARVPTSPMTYGWDNLLNAGMPFMKRRVMHQFSDQTRVAMQRFGPSATQIAEHALKESVVWYS